jgi:hypothetical protein
MTIKKFTELDFQQIKQNLKDFLRNQPEFQDYNFEGSGINLLLDVLAYNTGYNAFYSNMIANESFLDSAILRNNVISRAKSLGYVPTSIRAPYATLNVTVKLPSSVFSQFPEYIIVPLHHEFTSRSSNQPIQLYTMDRVVLPKTTLVGGVQQYSADIDIYQGKKITHKFTVDNQLNSTQRFILPNANIDSTKLFVTILQNSGVTQGDTWTLAKDVTEVGPDDNVYFLQEADNEFLELYFGDGFIGKKLVDGNQISATYFVTDGPLYHGLSKFTTTSLTAPNSVTIAPQYISITTLESLRNGSDKETIESVKFKAPLYYDTQARAVTKSDYETLLIKDYPQIEHVRVWGGEDNSPPKYGVVFVSAKPKNGLTFNTIEKESIINTIIRPRNMVAIEVEMVDPEYMNIGIETTVRFEGRKNSKSSGQIENSVRESINKFATDKLSGFDTTFRYSALLRYIDQADDSITGNITSVYLKYAVTPPFNVPVQYNFSFQSSLDLGDVLHDIRTIKSSGFIFNGFETFITDDGNGKLFAYRPFGSNKIIVNDNIGSVNYETGAIQISSLSIQGLSDGGNKLYFYATPSNGDFFASRNRMLLIQQTDVKVIVINENR